MAHALPHGYVTLHLTRKEDNMFNRKLYVAVWVAVLVSLAGAMNVYSEEAAKININTASAEGLTRLKGIGASHAAGIIAFRTENGPFKRPEDLVKVPRIGQKTFEKNKDLIVVADPDRKLPAGNKKLPKK